VDTVDGMEIDFGVFLCSLLISIPQPFVDPGHPLHDIFPPRVWAIRIPVILTLLGSAVVGTFIGIVMINSNKKKAAKAKAAAKKKT
jgi:dolichyl-phosphate mannosyltransferase polypeptide 2 regulatory subunit